ncbi:hypothetical protein [Shewanella algae]|uniref:hypothetical protein n=1 Tax=Shewanella algae TaxID=38313 RepID=UPI0031F51A1C
MKLSRIDAKRDIDEEVQRIEIIVNGEKITLTEKFGQLEIHGDCDDLLISCGSRNSFTVIAKNND